MRYLFLLSLALSFAASALGHSISSPAAGASWPVNRNQEIKWDTTGLTAPLDIHLIPAGAKDARVIITEIALSVKNTGSYKWAPSDNLKVANVKIIIIDSKHVMVISEVFIIVIIEETMTKKTTTKKTTTTRTKMSTKLASVTNHATSSFKINATAVHSVLSTSTASKMPPTLGSIQLPTNTIKPLNPSTKPLTTSPSSSIKLGTAITSAATLKFSNSTLLKSTHTADILVAKETLKGDASPVGLTNIYSVVSGSLVALLAVIFL